MLKIVKTNFLKSATVVGEYPALGEVEFAFFGRSNAGKSSLINFLLNKRNLVKVGSTPGKTQTINFFLIEALREENGQSKRANFILTDLPGYGYAKCSKEQVKVFDSMLYEYCTNRRNLRQIFLLMDARRDVTSVEKETLEFFHKLNIETKLIATKIDKIAKTKVATRIKEIEKELFGMSVEVIATSTLKNYGQKEVLSAIEKKLFDKLT